MVPAGSVWKGGVLRCSDGGCKGVCLGSVSAEAACGDGVAVVGLWGECGKASPAGSVFAGDAQGRSECIPDSRKSGGCLFL